MTRMKAVLTMLVCLLGTASVAHSDDLVEQRSPFDQGRWTASASLGSQSNFDSTYFVVGAGIGYYVVPGLQIGAGLEYWIGDGPSITLVEPNARYIFHMLDFPVKPYVGGFYRHWFIGDFIPDFDTVGARTGIVWVSSGLVFGVGVLYEELIRPQCSMDCDAIVPELSLALSF